MPVYAAPVPPASRRRQIFGLVLTMLVLAAAGTLWWVFRPPRESPGRATICLINKAAEQEEAEAEALCRRRDSDEAARRPLPPRTMMDPTASRVWRAVNDAACAPDVYSCPSRRPSTDQDVERIRRVLRDEGFPDAVVRLARPDDPAPAGAVMYAVTLPGDICIVADVELGNGARPADITGTLPSGRCLDT
ncbi:hypothetical protein [Actinoplanes sp. M2I2]|uniref:hypothetical protein n=1 Tax=Actinoplanes sp. M2I2 TaxID=1734444 RepID=UPI0020222276|nr:hypothetical protein [Actinoplanes sp. M2I2]